MRTCLAPLLDVLDGSTRLHLDAGGQGLDGLRVGLGDICTIGYGEDAAFGNFGLRELLGCKRLGVVALAHRDGATLASIFLYHVAAYRKQATGLDAKKVVAIQHILNGRVNSHVDVLAVNHNGDAPPKGNVPIGHAGQQKRAGEHAEHDPERRRSGIDG